MNITRRIVSLFFVTASAFIAAHADSTQSAAAEKDRLVIPAPKGDDVGYGSWDPRVAGGKAPLWAYFVVLRERYDPGRLYGTSTGSKAIHFFQGDTPSKTIELPLKPSSVKGWSSPDETVTLTANGDGTFIAYRRSVLGPMEQGARYPIETEVKVLNHLGETVNKGKDAHSLSKGGRFGWTAAGVQNLRGDSLIRTDGGAPVFSKYDDGFVVQFEGSGRLDYRGADGTARWSAGVAEGPMRNVAFSPSGTYVFEAAGVDREPQSGDVAGVIGPTGRVLWKMPVIPGVYGAAFSQDERVLALVTRDANRLIDVETGKVLANVPMTRIFNDENRFPINLAVYMLGSRAVIVARTVRVDKGGREPMPGRRLGNEPDVVYEFGPEGGRVLAEWPAKTFALRVAGNIYEPIASLDADSGWLYYLTHKGLFARQL